MLLLAIAFTLLLAACADPSRQFTFENATDSPVTIRVNDRLRALVRPGETASFNTPNNKGNRRVLAVDERGTVRLDRNFTWQELEDVGFHVVIR